MNPIFIALARIKNQPSTLALTVLLLLSLAFHQTVHSNPFETNVVSWGSMQMLDQPVIAIAAAGFSTVALKQDGTVAAWGYQDFSRCNVPFGLDSVKTITVGENHTVALRQNGTVVAWGKNENGQTTVPESLGKVKSIAAGHDITVALLGDDISNIQNRFRTQPFNPVLTSHKAGTLLFSSPLPTGTTVALFDLNGRIIFKTVAQGASVKLPHLSADRIALWRVAHPKLNASGRILLKQW